MTDPENDKTQFDADDELRELLRTSDPAHSLPPANAAALAHLLEDIMSTDLDVRPPMEEGTRVTGTRGRGPLTWLVAAAAVTVIAGAAGFGLSNAGEDSAPPTASDPVAQAPADPGSGAGAADPTAPIAGTTDLSYVEPLGRCMAPNAAFVAQQQQAFAGTVTAVAGDSVTLSTTDVYTGQVGQTVVVTAPPSELQSLIASTKFEVGGTYLVSATDGVVSVCGMSGKASGDLQTLYNEAFAR